jgi:GT2 family glycosyltransferase
MSISIVMLTYNNYEKILRSMTSMFYFLTEPKIKEFIVLDNGSHQHELKVFLRRLEEQVSKFRVIWSDKNLGIAKGRKVLFDVAEGEYIASFDSDIVILNPPLFLDVFYKALDIPGMMLVGGGGGDHTYFPSLERENIDNKESPETHQELKIVEEVAGWFQGFKSSILTKNGGKVEMDEQFTPFWAEDSDFCMQIRMLGGKCCIMGKGVVAHQWSSCDKKKTQTTLEEMWNLFQDKWYKIFGKDFVFEIDDEFYRANYPNSKIMSRAREFYYKIGMIEGHFYSREAIKLLFKDISFPSLTEVTYNNETMSIKDFDTKVFNYDNIVKNNFQIVSDNMPRNIDTMIILTVFDITKALEILKQLISVQFVNVAVCLPTNIKHSDIEVFLRKYKCNFLIAKFPNFNFDLIPYIITFNEIKKKIKFKKILNLSTERDNSEYLKKPLENFREGFYLEQQVTKIDKFNMSFIDQVVTLHDKMMWNKDCVFYEKTDILEKTVDSFPVKDTLIKCLKIPKKYINYISPRCSPKHSLERIFGYIKPKVSKKYLTFYTVLCEINNEDDLVKLNKNISYFKNGEISLFNTGTYQKINLKNIQCDYYFAVDKGKSEKDIWTISLQNVEINKYSNFVFSNNNFEIMDPIDEFLDRSLFKNTCFLEKVGDLNLSLFSIVAENIGHFINSINAGNADIKETLRKMAIKVIWNSKEEESEDEYILEYFKNGIDNGEDLPICFY